MDDEDSREAVGVELDPPIDGRAFLDEDGEPDRLPRLTNEAKRD